MSELPVIDEAVVFSIFKEIEAMDVTLDEDPLELGPKRITNKIADTRKHLTRCEQLFVRVSHWLQLYNRAHRAATLDFELAMQDMLANDPEVRAGRNVKDRDAIATIKVRERREDIDQLALMIQDLEAMMSVVRSKRIDLRDTQNRLNDQKKLCQEEIGLGGKWGSKIHTGQSEILPRSPSVDAVTMRELNALLAGRAEQDVSQVLPPVTEGFIAPQLLTMMDVFQGSGSQGALDDLLGEIDLDPVSLVLPSSGKDVSIDDFLDSLI